MGIDRPGTVYPEHLKREPVNAAERWEQDWMPPTAMWQLTDWKNGISTNNEVAKNEDWPIDRSGSGREFVKLLRRDDRIGILARTLVSGWEISLARLSLTRPRDMKLRTMFNPWRYMCTMPSSDEADFLLFPPQTY
jgi:hypothetical protein